MALVVREVLAIREAMELRRVLQALALRVAVGEVEALQPESERLGMLVVLVVVWLIGT